MTNENNVKEADEQTKIGKLKGPGHFVWIPKTSVSIAGSREAEVYSVEQLMSYIDVLIKKIGGFPELAVQKKYDGISIQIHYDGKKFIAFTEQGFDITARFPKLIELASSQFPDTPYIIIGEIEQWERGSHSGRGDIIGYLNSTSKPDDSKLCVSIFECIWFNGDIHDKTYEDRFTILEEKFKISQSLISELKHGFNLTPTFIVKNKAALQKAVQKVIQPKESEGAVIKIWKGFHFSLNKRTNEMIKFKKFAEAHFIVLEKTRIKGVTFQYHIGIEVRSSERDSIVEDKTEVYNEKTYIRCGKTFNSNIQASVGDIITIRFGNLNIYHRNEKMYFGIYEPSVYENRTTSSKEEEPDNITSLMAIGEESGLLVEKGIGVYVSKATDPFLQYPSENKSSSYVMQEHFRGKTAHVDFRIKVGNILIGYTLMNQIEGEIKDPVLTIDQGRKLLDNSKNWKFNPKTGEFQERKGKDGKIRTTSIQAALKTAEPLEWLDVEGVTEEGDVGSTKKFPGVFVIAAKGEVDYGYREPYFHEYFVYNKEWKNGGQKLVFRLLSGSELKQSRIAIQDILSPFTDNPENYYVIGNELYFDGGFIDISEFDIDRYKKYLIKVLPPSEEPNREMPFVWLMIHTKDVEPYILSKRARQKEKYPPVGISALPHSIKKQIPSQYQYWTSSTNSHMRERLLALRQAMKEGEVVIDMDESIIFSKTYKALIRKEKDDQGIETKYVLKRRFWRGPVVVRLGKSAEFFDLYFRGEKGWKHFILLQNPVDYDNFAGWLRDKEIENNEVDFEGELKPDHELNPNKKIPVQVQILGKGKVLFDQEEKDKWFLQFKDGALGDRTFSAVKDAGIWKFSLD